MSEKPLHVRVAEALGWVTITDEDRFWVGRLTGDLKANPRDLLRDATGRYALPLYDTDWSATGPLIEQYGFHVQPMPSKYTLERWGAFLADFDNAASSLVAEGFGGTPLIAVCNLICALKEAGKLDLTPPAG